MAGDRVRAELARSGGIVGRTIRRGLDTAHLPDDQAQQLRELVTAAESLSGTAAAAPPRGADRFSYQLDLHREGHTATVSFSEPVPEALQPLVTLLSRAPLLPAGPG